MNGMARLNVAATFENIVKYAQHWRFRDTADVLVKTRVESDDAVTVKEPAVLVPNRRETQRLKMGFPWPALAGIAIIGLFLFKRRWQSKGPVLKGSFPNEIDVWQNRVGVFWLPLAMIFIIGLSLAIGLIGTVAVLKLLKQSNTSVHLQQRGDKRG